MSVRISVVIPSYNQGKFIENAILSILKQDYEDWELIIQDGDSRDETKEICERYAALDERVQFRSEPDSGYAEAVNRALSKCSGQMVGIQSSDDFYLHGSVFSQLAETLKRFPNLTIVSGRHVYTDGQLREIPLQTGVLESGFLLPETIYTVRYRCEQSATFFSLRRALDVGGMDPDLDGVADTDLWIRMATVKPTSIDALYRVPYLWGGAVIHDSQRGNDGCKFFVGEAHMWMKHWRNPTIDLSESLKFATASRGISTALQHVNALGRDITPMVALYRQLHQGRFPLRQVVKGYLSKSPAFRRRYYKHWPANNSLETMRDHPPGYSVRWF
jgi:glycosyltransferase involved in cell wall biosynthesis